MPQALHEETIQVRSSTAKDPFKHLLECYEFLQKVPKGALTSKSSNLLIYLNYTITTDLQTDLDFIK